MKIDVDQVGSICARLAPLNPMRDPAKIGWVWLSDWTGLRRKAGLNAAYLAANDSIGIPDYHASMLLDEMLLPTYCHELCHAEQRRRLGLAGYLWAKTFNRGRLEAEAVIEEKRVQALLKVHVL